MKTNISKNNQGVKVISRAASILRLLGQETGGLSLGQIATRVELPRSTVQRIVSALADEGLISNTNGSGNIRLGPAFLAIAEASSMTMQSRLRPVMKSLSEETGETVDLAILDKGRMRFIDQIEGSQRLRTVSRIGELFPLTTTANGKAALALLSRASATKLIQAETGSPSQPTPSLKHLIIELDEIRAGHLAKDENEHTEGICAFGVAVTDSSGEVFALSTPVPSSRFHRIKYELAASIKRHVNQFELTQSTNRYK